MENKDYSYVQSSPGIILQFKISYNSTQYNMLRNVSGSLGAVVEHIDDNSTIPSPVQLTNQSFTVIDDVITVKFDHPEQEFLHSSVLQVNYQYGRNINHPDVLALPNNIIEVGPDGNYAYSKGTANV